MTDGVDGLPGDEHRHDGGLAGAGRELQGEAEQLGIGLGVAAFDVGPEFLGTGAELGGDLDEPDRGLDCLDLAEEGADALERVVAPVGQQAGGLGRDEPLVGFGQVAPGFDIASDLVDDRGRVVFLLVGGEVLCAEIKSALPRIMHQGWRA